MTNYVESIPGSNKIKYKDNFLNIENYVGHVDMYCQVQKV